MTDHDDPFDINRFIGVGVDMNMIERVAGSMDLRLPNKAAIANVAAAFADHENGADDPEPLEVVVDSAVGVGKTYVMAGLIEYLASAERIRNVAIITPSTVITEKTILNFTANNPRSLTEGMDWDPVVVTSDNFNTPAMRAVMADPNQVKVYVFTVHALLTPRAGTKAQRRTHSYQEGLGKGFYDHLRGLDDLVILADEHHAYYGDAFSKAIRDLEPRMLVGLTGTPDKRAEDEVIFRYPLADAIADGYVKFPVIVGRTDDRDDLLVKLNDGTHLLELKQTKLDEYSEQMGLPRVNAVMLVLCKDIAEARSTADLIASNDVADGRYADSVLEVHSKSATHDDDLRNLDAVEHPDSKTRVIVAVDKLKEGWDVKNVYVLLSLRPSVSEILTEQTLGRGLRLPYGARTGISFLDSLEVLAHERFEDLLARRGALSERLVSYRVRQRVVTGMDGAQQLERETVEVAADIGVVTGAAEETAGVAEDEVPSGAASNAPSLSTVGERVKAGDLEMTQLISPLRSDMRVPVLKTAKIRVDWSLADIDDLEPFRALGRQISKTGAEGLRRVTITAQRKDGVTSLGTAESVDSIEGYQEPLPLEDAKGRVRNHILVSRVAPARLQERRHLERILDEFYGSLSGKAEKVLTQRWRTAAQRIIEIIEGAARLAPKNVTTSVEVVWHRPFGSRQVRSQVTTDLRHKLAVSERNSLGYEGWAKSLYSQVWFDSDTERQAAVILDTSADVDVWVRLHPADLPIEWSGEGRSYNPDFLVKDTSGAWWVVEVKADNEIASESVAGKATAARIWANKVNADDDVEGEWKYLLVGETDIKQAKGTWAALTALGR